MKAPPCGRQPHVWLARVYGLRVRATHAEQGRCGGRWQCGSTATSALYRRTLGWLLAVATGKYGIVVQYTIVDR